MTKPDLATLEKTIEKAFDERDGVNTGTRGEIRDAVETSLALLDKGQARVAERQADGSWTLRVRIQNISTVPMRYERVEATLRIAQFEAGRLSLMPGVSVGPNSAETVETTLIPNAEAARAVQDALSSGRGVRYAFEGEIASSDPRRTDRFTHQSVLSPVPGLDGVLR